MNSAVLAYRSGVDRLRPVMTLARFRMVDALRSRLLWILFLVALLALGSGLFGAEMALVERRQVAISGAAPLLRVAAVLLLALLVAVSTVREFNDRSVLIALAAPLPRSHWMLGHLVGSLGLAMIVALACAAPLLTLAAPVAVAAWALSLAFELAIVAALALASASAFKQVPAALMACVAFYVLSRLMGVVLMLDENAALASGSLWGQLGSGLIRTLGVILPSLDLFTRTDWLLEGVVSLAQPVVQGLIYVGLLFTVAVLDLSRHDV